jgi:dipeptidyl aminopeptidase/acylaminoacyl peptidase
MIQFLVNHGYAILAVNHRGSSGYGKTFFKSADKKHGEADLDDCVEAKKYLISTGMIDPEKIGIYGGSYGGYMTLAALAFRPKEFAVGVDLFGISNWIQTLSNIPSWWETERESLYKKIGHPVKDADYLASISPLFHAKNIVHPLLVIQGANDPRVLKQESDQIIEAIKENNIPHKYVVFDDEGHGFSKKCNRIKMGEELLKFLDDNLKVSKEK